MRDFLVLVDGGGRVAAILTSKKLDCFEIPTEVEKDIPRRSTEEE
jgi:hypothetical protein